MRRGESTPWHPEPLDQMLEEPFQRLERQRNEYLLRRLDEMYAELQAMEIELDEMLRETAECR